MQTLFGFLSKDNEHEKMQSYFVQVNSVYKTKRVYTCLDMNFGFGLEQNVRSSFTKEFSFPGNVKMILAGDFVEKNEINRLVLSVGKEGLEDTYTFLKSKVISLIQKIDGIFCIVLIDPMANRMCLFSDEHGIMPIYYFFDNKILLYGTSLKCVISFPGFVRQVNDCAIYELFKIGFTLPPSTLLRNVKMLIPGEILEYNGTLKTYKGRKSELPHTCVKNIDELAEEYYECLNSSILKLTSDFKDITILLSGGIDSAAIAAILCKKDGTKLTCLTIDLNYNDQAESLRAQKVAALFGIEHDVVNKIDDSMAEYMPEVIWYNEAPTYNGIAEYVLAKKISRHTELVLTGDGNDLIWGVFGIYPNNYLENTGIRFFDYYLKLRSCMSDRLLDNILINRPDKSFLFEKINYLYSNSGDLYSDSILVDQKLFGSSFAYNIVGKIRVELSAALFRFPYLDRRVEALINRLPLNYKLRQQRDELIHKYLFKFTLEKSGILPHEIIFARKRWMQSPNAEWLRAGLKDYFEIIVFQNDSAVKRFFKEELIKDLWALHQFRKLDYSYFLMMVLTFELWYKEFIENDSHRFKIC